MVSSVRDVVRESATPARIEEMLEAFDRYFDFVMIHADPGLVSFDRSFAAPTAAQAQAWPAFQAGRHVLIAAPTGSGKTLAAFLAAIDALVDKLDRQILKHKERNFEHRGGREAGRDQTED